MLLFFYFEFKTILFRHLENWIFNGVLDDVADELFICYVNHYRPNTKYFFDKAYFIRKDSVPGFIQGHEHTILQCGKYTMLLKALNPNVSMPLYLKIN